MADGHVTQAEILLRQVLEIFQRTGEAEAADVAASVSKPLPGRRKPESGSSPVGHAADLPLTVVTLPRGRLCGGVAWWRSSIRSERALGVLAGSGGLSPWGR
jgi:hypothetical protein